MSPIPGIPLPLVVVLVPLWILAVILVIWLGLRSSKARGLAAVALVFLGLVALLAGALAVGWGSVAAHEGPQPLPAPASEPVPAPAELHGWEY